MLYFTDKAEVVPLAKRMSQVASTGVLGNLVEGLRYCARTPGVVLVLIVVGAIGTFGYNFSGSYHCLLDSCCIPRPPDSARYPLFSDLARLQQPLPVVLRPIESSAGRLGGLCGHPGRVINVADL